jgi:hypothetical protein
MIYLLNYLQITLHNPNFSERTSHGGRSIDTIGYIDKSGRLYRSLSQEQDAGISNLIVEIGAGEITGRHNTGGIVG